MRRTWKPGARAGRRVLGHRASGQPARPQNNLHHRSEQPLVIIVDPVGHRGRFRAQLDERVLVASSRTPFCDAARVLVAEGFDPATRIAMRHAGSATDALTATVGGAAQLTVEEGDRLPHLRRWRPSPHAAETPGIAPSNIRATPIAAVERLISAPTFANGDSGDER
jgi:hypothetical protein